MDYYIQWECPHCDETNYYGLCRTLLEHNGKPCITLTGGDQESYECESCGKTFYTGDTELWDGES